MIPERLELTNFLSYRQPTVLSFEAIHLACISGLNGAGKSSLLDAVTWALFGKSRSKSDDDVVNRLAAVADEPAEVQFTFRLEASTYRVIRRKRSGKPVSLELQMGAGEAWKTLSESRVRETQAAIEALLHMNYDTFTNASFLLQGQADEFTTKTPSRRKEILADLLGVTEWDRYREAAAQQRREVEGELQLREGQLAEIEVELAEEEERKATLAAAQAEVEAISQRRALQEQLLQQARATDAAVKQQQQQVQALAQNRDRARRTLAEWQQTRERRQQERNAHQEVLAAAAGIEADLAAYQAAAAEVERWQQQAEAVNRLQQARRPHELAVAQERSRLAQRQRELLARQARLAAAGEERPTLTATAAAARERLETCRTRLAEMARQLQAAQEARAELQQLEGERQLLSREAEQLQKQAQRVETLLAEKPAVAANLAAAQARLADLAAEIAGLAEARSQHATALADKNLLESKQPGLRQRMQEHKERIDGLSADSGGACPLCGQTLTEAHRQAVLAELTTEGNQMGAEFRANRERIDALTSMVADLARRLQQADRLERDQVTQQGRLAQAEARLAEIEAVAAEWADGGGARLAALTDRLADDAALTAQREKVAALAAVSSTQAQLEEERAAAQEEIAAAEARLAEIQRAAAEWAETGAAALAEVTAQLESGDYAREDQDALARLATEMEAVAYEADAHAAARRQREALAAAPRRHQQLQEARAAVKPLEDSLAEMAERLAAQEALASELTDQHQAAAAQLEALAAAAGDLRAIEDEVFRLREEESVRQRTMGAAQQRLAVLADLRTRRQALRTDKKELAQQIQRLKLLEKAFGRDGVQALLIEQALPEIEDRANELLQRLTGGEMRVSFETQRQLKSRDATVETLDIHITDGAGERPYENFSGGEQFRVNFAIRLALSQILARRAGARLQTLVVDEGFGSQDPAGRQRLVEAINTVQDDFARILVITHIDELRDAFPTRVEVIKEVAGSSISII